MPDAPGRKEKIVTVMTTSMRIPRLPAAAKRAGATSIVCTVGDLFAVGFTIDETQGGAGPGKGQAVVDALAAAWPDAEVRWSGRQANAIIVDFRPASERPSPEVLASFGALLRGRKDAIGCGA